MQYLTLLSMHTITKSTVVEKVLSHINFMYRKRHTSEIKGELANHLTTHVKEPGRIILNLKPF